MPLAAWLPPLLAFGCLAITLGFAVAVIVTLILAGDRVILVIGGSGFEDAYAPLLVHTVAILLLLAGTSLRSGIMAAGRQLEMLGIVVASAGVYYITLFVAVPRIGIVGGSLAHVAFCAIWLPGSYLLFRRLAAKARTSLPGDAPNSPTARA